ncbi:MAG: hypothetical protein ACKO0V_13845 [bacterium]
MPTPRGNEISFFIRLPELFLNVFQSQKLIEENDLCDEEHEELVDLSFYNVAMESECPIDLCEGLVEKEIEKELEEEEGRDSKTSKHDFISNVLYFHFHHGSVHGLAQNVSNHIFQEKINCHFVLRC